MFVYGQDPQTGKYVIVDRDYKKVKTQLLEALTNFGQPIVKVVDGNHANRGELYLVHDWVGGDLDDGQARLTLQNLWKLWQRPVLLETQLDGRSTLLSYDGGEVVAKEITASETFGGRVGAMGKAAP